MTKVITIRCALATDLPVLRKFKQELVAHERQFDSTIPRNKPVFYYDLDALVEDPNTYFIVAEYEGVVCGCCFFQIRDAKPWSCVPKVGYIGFMFVSSDYRGKHVGKSLIDNVSQWASDHHITHIRLEVYSDNELAKAFYERVGFVPYLTEMQIVL